MESGLARMLCFDAATTPLLLPLEIVACLGGGEVDPVWLVRSENSILDLTVLFTDTLIESDVLMVGAALMVGATMGAALILGTSDAGLEVGATVASWSSLMVGAAAASRVGAIRPPNPTICAPLTVDAT